MYHRDSPLVKNENKHSAPGSVASGGQAAGAMLEFPSNSSMHSAHVAKLLEAGVSGIQLPWTEAREQIDRLVSPVKFPPVGIRAATPGYGNCDYEGGIDGTRFVEAMNRSTVILAHIETLTGVGNIDSILDHSHVDIAFVGMYNNLSINCVILELNIPSYRVEQAKKAKDGS